MAKKNRFTALSGALKGEPLPEQQEEETAPVPVEAPAQTPPKRGRATGKRSDPNYTQVGAYIPKQLYRDVKRLLIDEDADLSDLVTKLLEEWVSSKSAK